MDYVLYVPGMPFNGETIPGGRSLGGSESAGYYLARELARRGHGVTVFAAIAAAQAGSWEGVAYRPIGPATESTPFGEAFEAFVAGTPCDVLIGQRAPGLFHRPTAAKVHLWWSHDLALRRYLPAFNRGLWNLNAVLCVSAWHKAQVAEVYGLPPERVAVAPNGVDATLFPPPAESLAAEARQRGKVLVYSSRPERGLEHLLGSDDAPGIMERLAAEDPEIRLKVCGYDNTAPELAGYYARLRARCAALPNVEWLGPLSKAALAGLMSQAWLHVYPTTFEETSCITAMEAQTAGTPIVTTPVAALPETLREGGVHWVPLTPEGAVHRENFARAILGLRDDPPRYKGLHAAALAKAPAYGWSHAADAVESVVADCLARQTDDAGRLARHLLRHSDIAALEAHLAAQLAAEPLEQPAEQPSAPLVERTRAELTECYAFARGDAAQQPERLARHYADYYAHEAARGVVYGPERLAGQPRFEAVARQLATLPPGARVLDYGCAHGHFTVNLAQRFPHLRFLGVDLVERNIAAAREWAAAEGLGERVAFRGGTEAALGADEHFALIVAAEVLEHVPQPAALADALAAHLEPRGRMVITTPYGPWEALGFAEHHPWRAHLHHLERADLTELFGHHPDFATLAVPAGETPRGEALGSWVTTFRRPERPSGRVDLARKLRCQRPHETLSVCMVVAPQGETLARCLKSVAPIADELILGIDAGPRAERRRPGEGGHAWALAEQYGATAFALQSPLETGFAAARNATLARASGDRILWIDDDEELLWPERLPKYLRDNPYDAYAVPQHHFAVEPGGVIKTDYPCRLFRNRRGFSFYGIVHEHPERGLNGGAGAVLLLPDVAICHNGYVTEAVRRARFARNLPLMQRDRAEHPQRVLGRFLWIRDLAHLNRFEQERGRAVTAEMLARAEQAVGLWRELLAEGHTRLAVDALPYYSEATRLLTGGGIDFQASLGVHCLGLGDAAGAPPALQGSFLDAADIEALTQALLKEKVAAVTGKYV